MFFEELSPPVTRLEGQGCQVRSQAGPPLAPVFSILPANNVISSNGTEVTGPSQVAFLSFPVLCFAFPLVDATRCPMKISQ